MDGVPSDLSRCGVPEMAEAPARPSRPPRSRDGTAPSAPSAPEAAGSTWETFSRLHDFCYMVTDNAISAEADGKLKLVGKARVGFICSVSCYMWCGGGGQLKSGPKSVP